MKSQLSIILLILCMFGCASTPATIVPEMQFGYVYLGSKGGNKIIIPNLDEIPAYNIYRKSSTDTTFIFVTKETRPSLPMRYRMSPYAIEWVDEDNISATKYKVVGLNDQNKEWFEAKLEYLVPKK